MAGGETKSTEEVGCEAKRPGTRVGNDEVQAAAPRPGLRLARLVRCEMEIMKGLANCHTAGRNPSGPWLADAASWSEIEVVSMSAQDS